MQGDLFDDVPLNQPSSAGTPTEMRVPAVLLTPTCDFALKRGVIERQVTPIEPLAENDPRLRSWQSSGAPLHLFHLPPLEGVLPSGGLLHFRGATSVHSATLERSTRVATLDAAGLRALLAAHSTYYTRAAIDPAQVPIAPDDPRLLWEAIDEASAVPGLADRRHALQGAVQIAIQALARHHGITAPSVAAALAWLEVLAGHHVLPARSSEAVRVLTDAQGALTKLYALLPADLSDHEVEFHRLEGLGTVLQERHPLQITPAQLREAGLANLLR